VNATYQPGTNGGLLLANGSDQPVARDRLTVWDLRTDRAVRAELPGLGRDRAFLASPEWVDDSTVALLASDLRKVDSEKKDPGWPHGWNEIISYRLVANGAFCASLDDLPARIQADHMFPLVHVYGGYLQIERLANGHMAVWTGTERGRNNAPGPENRVIWMDKRGRIKRDLLLPRSRWRSSVGAVGTARTTGELLAVREVGDSRRSLCRVVGSSLTDVYCPDRSIVGVFGSPDGRYVATLEDRAKPPSLARCDIVVLPAKGGTPITAARDAYGQSRLAWSPDGKRIAYVRCTDGHIVISEVPRQ
jgi:hypothetical protein